jgi:small subunit ribosomal protein S18
MSTPAAGPGGARPGPRRRPGEFGGGGAGRKFTPRRKVCQFCVDKVKEVDYKDLGRLRRFLSERGKIEPRRKTGTCAAHQRSLNVALKRARQLALLPFTAEHIRITGVLVREPGAAPFRGNRGPRRDEAEGGAPEAPAAGAEAPAAGAEAPAAGAEAPAAGAEAPADGAVAATPETPVDSQTAPSTTEAEAPAAAAATADGAAETPAAAATAEA